MVHRSSAILLSRCDFGKAQREERLARYTEVCRLWGIHNGKHFSFATARARSGGIRSLGIGRHREWILQFTHLGGFELESRIAIVADVVETTRRLAGVKHILGSALRAGNGNWGKPHRPSEWRSTTGAVKHGETRERHLKTRPKRGERAPVIEAGAHVGTSWQAFLGVIKI